MSRSSSTFPAGSNQVRAAAFSMFLDCRTQCPSSATKRSFPSKSATSSPAPSGRGWLLNVTDDVWFGQTPGPYQHFAQARLRAIELGLPLVRDANSGISAVVDGFGREIVASPLGADGVLDAELPESLAPTWQSRLGSVGAALIGLALLAAALAGKRHV